MLSLRGCGIAHHKPCYFCRGKAGITRPVCSSHVCHAGVPLFPGKSNMDQLWLILKTVGCTPRQQSRMRGSKAFAGMKMPTDEEMIPLEKRLVCDATHAHHVCPHAPM